MNNRMPETKKVGDRYVTCFPFDGAIAPPENHCLMLLNDEQWFVPVFLQEGRKQRENQAIAEAIHLLGEVESLVDLHQDLDGHKATFLLGVLIERVRSANAILYDEINRQEDADYQSKRDRFEASMKNDPGAGA